MTCEIRDVESQEVFGVPPEGAVFGRAGGTAAVTVSDQAVSKRHARVFLEGGVWYLEDLNSVNGTVVNSRKITERVPLTPGLVFSLSKHRFEVVSVSGQSASDPRRSARGAPTGAPGREPSANAASSAGVLSALDHEPMLPSEASRSRLGGAGSQAHEAKDTASPRPAPDGGPADSAAAAAPARARAAGRVLLGMGIAGGAVVASVALVRMMSAAPDIPEATAEAPMADGGTAPQQVMATHGNGPPAGAVAAALAPKTGNDLAVGLAAPKPDQASTTSGGAPALPATAYTQHKEKLAFVEAAIANNPVLLMDDARVAVLYKELSRQKVAAISNADEAVPKKDRAEMKFFLERYREAYVFKRTQKTVDQLYRVLRPE